MIVATTSRRHYGATFRRPPAPNWQQGMRAALAELYSTTPVPADQVAELEHRHAAVPYLERQGDLPLALPERPSE